MPFRASGDNRLDLFQVPILGPHPRENGFDRLIDESHLALRDEIRSHHGQPLRKRLAVISAEQEVNCRQHVSSGERVDDFPGLGLVHLRSAAFGPSLGESSARGLPPQLAASMGKVAHLSACVVDDEIQFAIDEIVQCEWNGPLACA